MVVTRGRGKKRSFGKALSLIFKTIWRDHKVLVLVFVAMSLASGSLAAVSPRIMQGLIDMITSGIFDSKNFTLLLALFILSIMGTAVFRFLSNKANFYLATQAEDKWRYAALRHYYDLPLAWHDKHDSGEIGNRIDRGGSSIFVIIAEVFSEGLFISTITLLLILTYTFLRYPTFGFLLVAPLPLYLLVTYFTSKKLVVGQTKLNKLDRMAGTAFYDGVGNYRAVKSFGKETDETKNYSSKWDAFHLLEYKLQRVWLTQEFLHSLVEMGMRAVVLGYGVYSALGGALSVGEVVLLFSYQAMTFEPMKYLNRIYIRLRRNLKRASNLFDIVSEEDLLGDKPGTKEIGPIRGEVLVEKVGFKYTGKIPALKDVSLRIPAGTTTALVGKSGSGKTTLALLLMRFYDPVKGKITFDGVDLGNIKRSSLREHVAWIPQDTSLFNRSIWENISYGNKKATMKEIIEAAKLAHAHDFILKTPKRYDSVIGERGVRLSGGQRQRIAIARALLTKPSLLILDEATSHLDSETEQAIKESIRKLHHKTTLVIIAHRLSTILHADQIAVMDKGRVLDVKKHSDLLKSSQLYKALYKLQFHKGK